VPPVSMPAAPACEPGGKSSSSLSQPPAIPRARSPHTTALECRSPMGSKVRRFAAAFNQRRRTGPCTPPHLRAMRTYSAAAGIDSAGDGVFTGKIFASLPRAVCTALCARPGPFSFAISPSSAAACDSSTAAERVLSGASLTARTTKSNARAPDLRAR